MEDATGQPICQFDLVMFNKEGGRHDRGVAVKALLRNKHNLVCVQLVDATLVVKKACELTVVDRAHLFPGMTVTSPSDPGGQAGVITGVATALDLVQLKFNDGGATELPPTVVATGVSPAEVRPVKEVTLGDYVVSGTWLGRVVELSVDVDVLFGDGSVCRVTAAGDKLRAVGEAARRFSRPKNSFYPGDGVAGVDATVFEASRWLKGNWKPTHGGVGTVAKVEMGGVLVYWVASLQTSSAPPAPYQPDARNLTFFSTGAPDLMWFWIVGARCFFRARPTPAMLAKKRKKRRADRRHPLAGFEWPMAVACTHTTVDVLWQDGTRQQGVPSASLLLSQVRIEQDFFPGQRVVMGKMMMSSPIADDDENAAGGSGRVGVVKSLSHKDQTVRVSWIKAGSGEVDTLTMGTYELCRSSDHSFFYGDIVVRRRPRDETVTAQRSNEAFNDLSWVGHIVDLCDTQYIHVKWGDGNMSKVLLHEIAFVKERSIVEMLQEMRRRVHDDEDAPVGAATSTGWAVNIFQAVIRTAAGMLSHAKKYLMSGSMALVSRVESAIMDNIQTFSPRTNAEEAAAVPAAAFVRNNEAGDVFQYQHFDVVQRPQDHHYLDNKEQGSGGGREWLKRVQKEWKVLETSLPDTIYVRVFENRMDLLRAVMVGASGTPYHNGLFFFDLQLPPSYPAMPPQVKYHSFGLRANPNLYPSGTVCLSLLNTFGGEGPELWSPETSSILQVLVSIQGLVLTAQPYYNEAGYAAQVGTSEGRRNELPYCENTYLVNLRTMLHLIRLPPAGFEAFVREHFRRQGCHILRACEAYLEEGYPISTLDGDARATVMNKERPCSVGFKLALANIVPQLVQAFVGIGAHGCNKFDPIRVPRLCSAIVF